MKLSTKLGIVCMMIFITAAMVGYGAAAVSDITGATNGATYTYKETVTGSGTTGTNSCTVTVTVTSVTPSGSDAQIVYSVSSTNVTMVPASSATITVTYASGATNVSLTDLGNAASFNVFVNKAIDNKTYNTGGMVPILFWLVWANATWDSNGILRSLSEYIVGGTEWELITISSPSSGIAGYPIIMVIALAGIAILLVGRKKFTAR